MNCDQIKTLLVRFSDNELDAQQREIVRLHVESCVDCNAELEALRSSLDAFCALAGQVEPIPVRRGLAEEICNVTESRSVTPMRFRVAIAAAAAIVVVCIIAGLIRMSRTDREPPVPVPSITKVTPAITKSPPPIFEAEEPAVEPRQIVEVDITESLYEIRMAAVELAMAERVEAQQTEPDIRFTATELYAQIPAIMFAAAKHVDRYFPFTRRHSDDAT